MVVRNLRKKFKKSSNKSCFKRRTEADKVHIAVHSNTFSVSPGEVLGLLGPNGAGKTTTLNMIMAEVTPTMGEVCHFISSHRINHLTLLNGAVG